MLYSRAQCTHGRHVLPLGVQAKAAAAAEAGIDEQSSEPTLDGSSNEDPNLNPTAGHLTQGYLTATQAIADTMASRGGSKPASEDPLAGAHSSSATIISAHAANPGKPLRRNAADDTCGDGWPRLDSAYDALYCISSTGMLTPAMCR